MKIKITKEEVIKAKFQNTIDIVNRYLKEAQIYTDLDDDYLPEEVLQRIEKIKISLNNDIKNLLNDITI